VDEAAEQQLAEDAACRQLRYLFPFVTYVQADGSFSPSYGHASEFAMKFRRFNHETQLLAWIGIPLQRYGVVGIDGISESVEYTDVELLIGVSVSDEKTARTA
jgi:hypothetical protein